MELKSFVSVNKEGTVVPSAKAYVYKRKTTTLAEVFDATGNKLPNPFTSDQDGVLEFSAADGSYDIQFEFDGKKGVKYAIDFSDSAQIVKSINDVKTDATATKADVTTAKSDIAGLKIDSDAAKNDITALQTDSVAVKTDVTNLKKTTSATATEVTALKSDLSSVEQSVKDLPTAITDLGKVKTDVATLKTNVAGFDTRITEATTQANSATEVVSEIGNRVGSVEQTVSGYDDEIAKISGFDGRITTVETTVSGYDAELAKVSGINDRVDAVETKVTGYDAELAKVAGINDRVDTVETTVSGYSTEIAKVSGFDTRIGAVETKATDNGTAITKNATDITNLGKTVGDQATAIAKANTDIAGVPAVVKTELAAEKGYSLIGTVESFAKLRTIKPDYAGQEIILKAYDKGSKWGGGKFTGYLVNKADDGGYVASSGAGFYWTRSDKTMDELTIIDFGGRPDGVFDCHDSIVRMYECFQTTYTAEVVGDMGNVLKIRLPPGRVYTTPLDMTRYGKAKNPSEGDYNQNPSGYGAAKQFHIEGAGGLLGKSIGTTLISDKSDNIMLHVNHRCVSVRNLIIDGQQTTKQDTATKMLIGATVGVFNDTATNKQPFFKNDCPAGQFTRINCVTSTRMGGYTFTLIDILDTYIDQVYCNNIAAPFLITTWSDPNFLYYGGWNHSTALELSNFNFQYASCPAIWTPRVGQGLIRNGWMEHSYMPFDCNNCQYVIDALSVEDCAVNGIAWQPRFAGIRQYSDPTGNYIDYTSVPGTAAWKSYPKNPDGTDITSWLSGYESGWSRLEATWSEFNHPVIMNSQAGVIRGDLPGSAGYLNIGSFNFLKTGGRARILIMTRSGFGSMGTTDKAFVPTDARAPGMCVIDVARANANVPAVNFYSEGHTGITEVMTENTTFNDVVPSLWVKLPAGPGEYSVYVMLSGITRRDNGSWGRFTPSNVIQTAKPGNMTMATASVSLHTGKAGWGAREDALSVKGRSLALADVDMTKPYGFIGINIGNNSNDEVAWPLYAKNPKITTQPPATLAATAGTSVSMSVVASDTQSYQWQKSADGTTWNSISGARSATYTLATPVVEDTAQYRVILRGKLADQDNAQTTNQRISSVTALTVTAAPAA